MQEGNIIYQGKAKDSPAYFKSIDFIIPKNTNPADFFMKKFFVPFKKTLID